VRRRPSLAAAASELIIPPRAPSLSAGRAASAAEQAAVKDDWSADWTSTAAAVR